MKQSNRIYPDKKQITSLLTVIFKNPALQIYSMEVSSSQVIALFLIVIGIFSVFLLFNATLKSPTEPIEASNIVNELSDNGSSDENDSYLDGGYEMEANQSQGDATSENNASPESIGLGGKAQNESGTRPATHIIERPVNIEELNMAFQQHSNVLLSNNPFAGLNESSLLLMPGLAGSDEGR